MGEAQLLEMRYSCGGAAGCSEEEVGMAAYFVRRLVLSAAGVVSGAKPASLFNFMPQSCMHYRDRGCEVCKAARETIAVGARSLARFGVTLVVLDRRGAQLVGDDLLDRRVLGKPRELLEAELRVGRRAVGRDGLGAPAGDGPADPCEAL